MGKLIQLKMLKLCNYAEVALKLHSFYLGDAPTMLPSCSHYAPIIIQRFFHHCLIIIPQFFD
ncbi:MAG: hypothetical protein WCR12_01755 [Dysgonamonadaceae bacterium]